MSELKKYPCAVCNSPNYVSKYIVKGFDIVRCTECSHVYVNPRLSDTELDRIYSNNYFHNTDYGYEEYESTSHLRKLNFNRWYNDLKPFLKSSKGKALDVGCASGLFLEILKKDSWEVKGIELDPAMIKKLKEQGIDHYSSKLESFETTEKFDLITLFDVIEHIPYPALAFDKLQDLLAPGGIIAIITPDYNSTQRKLFGKRWFQFKPMEHIHYFTPETLSRKAKESGLLVKRFIKVGQYADTGFILNRLEKYNYPVLNKTAALLTPLLKRIKPVYLDTGSLFAVIEKD
jgi:2-polyprenyl-3-methyl-5-hydroxy-6-metoxy-1,4-benzoquinol methylase